VRDQLPDLVGEGFRSRGPLRRAGADGSGRAKVARGPESAPAPPRPTSPGVGRPQAIRRTSRKHECIPLSRFRPRAGPFPVGIFNRRGRVVRVPVSGRFHRERRAIGARGVRRRIRDLAVHRQGRRRSASIEGFWSTSSRIGRRKRFPVYLLYASRQSAPRPGCARFVRLPGLIALKTFRALPAPLAHMK